MKVFLAKFLITLFIAANCSSVFAQSPKISASEKTEQKPKTKSESEQSPSILDQRVEIERNTRFKPYVLTPHKPNYIMPYTYNFKPNLEPFVSTPDVTLDNEEIKFQFSIKFPIVENLFGESGTFYFAYTNLSFWQAYNSSSSPFRETNHEPELFITVPNDWEFFGFKNRINMIGAVHQSNGRGGSLSRSWNRVYVDFIFERDNFYFSLKPWLRLSDTGTDDNPDIEDFLGHGEFRMVYATGKHTVSLMARNNFKADNKGALELNYSYPMSRRAKWFVQAFDGYGESLLDYNARSKRIGIGIALTDWL